jgi:hypothetical protein
MFELVWIWIGFEFDLKSKEKIKRKAFEKSQKKRKVNSVVKPSTAQPGRVRVRFAWQVGPTCQRRPTHSLLEMATGTNPLGFCRPKPVPVKNIYAHYKPRTHDGFEILSKPVPIGLAGTHGLPAGFISNILVHDLV